MTSPSWDNIVYFSSHRREIAPLLPDRTGRVLELGCGAGETMRWIREERPVDYAAAIELSPEAAARARGVFDEVVEADAVQGFADLAPGEFDLALALDVLEHLPDPEAAVRQLHGRLRPGGALLVSLPNVAHYRVVLPLLLRGRWDYADSGLLDRTHLRFFGEQSALALLTGNGFRIDATDYVMIVPNLLHWFGVEDRAGRWYTLRALGFTPFRRSHLFKFQFLIRAVRL